MAVTPEIFNKWAVETNQKINTVDGIKEKSVRIYPAPFCTIRYMNDPRKLSGEAGPVIRSNSRMENVIFAG